MNEYKRGNLKIYPCKWSHRKGNFTLNIVKCALYRLIKKIELVNKSEEIYRFVTGFFMRKGAKGGSKDVISAYITSYVNYGPSFIMNQPRYYFSMNYFRKHKNEIMKEIKNACIEYSRNKYYRNKHLGNY